MIKPNSPLLRIPANIDRAQSIVLDGVRHAAEITDLAYSRLCASLVLVQERWEAGEPISASEPLMYAWSMVDAIYRFMALRNARPLVRPPSLGGHSDHENDPLADIKRVRDVNDHPHNKLQQVVASRGAAIGALNWLRFREGPEPRPCSCALVPGSTAIGTRIALHALPVDGSFASVDRIVLRAGGHVADLSAALRHLELEVAEIERHLEPQLTVNAGKSLIDICVVVEPGGGGPAEPSGECRGTP